MSRPMTYEQQKLQKAEQFICNNTSSHSERLSLLEYTAASVSGLDIELYLKEFGYEPLPHLSECSKELLDILRECNIPIPYAISSLAREPITVDEQKKNGVFYTDYRLAEALRHDCAPYVKSDVRIADFAAGTGILLIGIVSEYKKKYKTNFDKWISNNLFAFDLSAVAIRGATAAVISLTDNVNAVISMRNNWRQCDSLLDEELDELKYDIIVGNPPWGKIKISRYSYSKLMGADAGYGEELPEFDEENYNVEKEVIQKYSRIIKEKYDLLGDAEPDMYMAFIQRSLKSLVPGGHMALIVPAGLIRSQGTEDLREYLVNKGKKLEYYLFDNKGSFFSIDSRFKFLVISFDLKGIRSALKEFSFRRCGVNADDLDYGEKISFEVKKLLDIRKDLTVPEISTGAEKDLYLKLHANAPICSYEEGEWKAEIYREVDMTNNRKDFCKNQKDGTIPLIEGRMVQQYRFGAKSYVSGSGRKAIWDICSGGGKPQFYFPIDELNSKQKSRISVKRVGFCDIAGQTNERAMMCTIIPENVVCGNKVPTIVFDDDPTGERVYLWTGIANSFVFDWLIRRIISTTINYFLLVSVPLPRLAITSKEAKEIIKDVKRLSEMGDEYYGNDEMERVRVRIEVNVAKAYGLVLRDMEVIMQDFPILDRHQPTLAGENKSTITRDAILSEFESKTKNSGKKYGERYKKEKEIGAFAFIPSEMVALIKEK